ncbi:MAG: efflux RND transporter periplasmic adaptor subunit [Gemmatimonadaceae bacterium]|nr:efflux RND transporter periplasmic adaptor subunit [Gemmatimonadaceae bacterium]
MHTPHEERSPRTTDDLGDAKLNQASTASGARFGARAALLLMLPAAAGLAAWWFTRDHAPQATAASADAHAAMGHGAAPSSDSARHVSLTADEARRIGVTFAPVTRAVLRHEVRTVGQVTVDETRVQTMTTRIDGFVEELFVDYTGRSVHRGEPLLRLYSPMLVTAQEELLLAHKLSADVTGASKDVTTGAADLAASARRRLEYWDVPAADIAAIERSGQVQRAMTMRATASGVVLEKSVFAGQRIMAGDALFRVADLAEVWVEGDVYEQDLRTIRTGQAATAEFEAWPGETWRGRIAWLSPTLSPETRTARVRVAFANPGLRLKPGMYATLHIAAREGASVVSVPRGAVLITGERRLVFVKLADGRLEPRTVELGSVTDDRIEVLRGVVPGDTVVASATFLVDAESSLGTALGGMGDMPGMEITVPPKPTPTPPTPPITPRGKSDHDHEPAR